MNVLKNAFFAVLMVGLIFYGCGNDEDVKTYTLTTEVNPENGGSVARSPDREKYETGEKVTLTATANEGYTFSGWESNGVVVYDLSPFDVTMDANKTYTAIFTADDDDDGGGDDDEE